MKKYLFAVLVIAVFSAGCNKSLAPEPPYPTPTPYIIDDVEDGDAANMVARDGGINAWNYGYGGSGSAVTGDVSGGNGGNYGSFCYGMTGTAKVDPVGFVLIGTWTLADDDTGTDFSAYKRLNFSLALTSGGPAGITYTCNVIAAMPPGIGNKARALIQIPADGLWHDYSAGVGDFAFETGAIGEVLQNTSIIIWEIRIESANPADTADINFYLDNVRFE